MKGVSVSPVQYISFHTPLMSEVHPLLCCGYYVA
jgi:hypothetical protein